ncbi:DUF1194 domain-containing protein [Flavimaricola marinus]|uniref:VWFA domain-containing protein n=1 Tax=Flavimaricola marinus TaxID=1819565 RepID=A0A238LIL6_9RHOB|nr:DUF1194 domain-containing protein [Flavimaricola marinus]SMY09462.1 hypothetical protein LOM8899_03629 [Flavimaricola marinus]
MMRLAALLACIAGPVTADCRQALALGLDVSGSVDAREYALQINGLAGALLDPEVRAVLLDQPEAPISLAVYEWSGPENQALLVPWTSITDEAALFGAVARLQSAQRQNGALTTAIGSALRTGFDLLDQRSDCLTLTLDISGDGPSNTGPRPQDVAHSGPRPITVNGLVIGTSDTNGDARLAEIKELSSYYTAYVIRGFGAFVETALGFEDYETAMRRKLLRELTSLAIGAGPEPDSAPALTAPATLPVIRVSAD